MRIPALNGDRLRNWFSNTEKTDTMIVDPIEAELQEEQDMDKQAYEALRASYAYMVKVAAPLQVQMLQQGHEDEAVNQEVAKRFGAYQHAQNVYRALEKETTDPNMPARHGLIGGLGGAALGGGAGYALGKRTGATLGALGGFIPGALLGNAYGRAVHERMYPGQLQTLRDAQMAYDDTDMDLEEIAELNPAAYRRARIMGGHKSIPSYDNDVENFRASEQEARELAALRKRLIIEQQIKDQLTARQQPMR